MSNSKQGQLSKIRQIHRPLNNIKTSPNHTKAAHNNPTKALNSKHTKMAKTIHKNHTRMLHNNLKFHNNKPTSMAKKIHLTVTVYNLL